MGVIDNHLRNEIEDFDRWVQLDRQVCNIYSKINKAWLHLVLQLRFKEQKIIDEATLFFHENYIVTGIIKENTAICNCCKIFQQY